MMRSIVTAVAVIATLAGCSAGVTSSSEELVFERFEQDELVFEVTGLHDIEADTWKIQLVYFDGVREREAQLLSGPGDVFLKILGDSELVNEVDAALIRDLVDAMLFHSPMGTTTRGDLLRQVVSLRAVPAAQDLGPTSGLASDCMADESVYDCLLRNRP